MAVACPKFCKCQLPRDRNSPAVANEHVFVFSGYLIVSSSEIFTKQFSLTFPVTIAAAAAAAAAASKLAAAAAQERTRMRTRTQTRTRAKKKKYIQLTRN